MNVSERQRLATMAGEIHRVGAALGRVYILEPESRRLARIERLLMDMLVDGAKISPICPKCLGEQDVESAEKEKENP